MRQHRQGVQPQKVSAEVTVQFDWHFCDPERLEIENRQEQNH